MWQGKVHVAMYTACTEMTMVLRNFEHKKELCLCHAGLLSLEKSMNFSWGA